MTREQHLARLCLLPVLAHLELKLRLPKSRVRLGSRGNPVQLAKVDFGVKIVHYAHHVAYTGRAKAAARRQETVSVNVERAGPVHCVISVQSAISDATAKHAQSVLVMDCALEVATSMQTAFLVANVCASLPTRVPSRVARVTTVPLVTMVLAARSAQFLAACMVSVWTGNLETEAASATLVGEGPTAWSVIHQLPGLESSILNQSAILVPARSSQLVSLEIPLFLSRPALAMES